MSALPCCWPRSSWDQLEGTLEVCFEGGLFFEVPVGCQVAAAVFKPPGEVDEVHAQLVFTPPTQNMTQQIAAASDIDI